MNSRFLLLLLSVAILGGLGYAVFQFKNNMAGQPTAGTEVGEKKETGNSSTGSEEWLSGEELGQLLSPSVVGRRKAFKNVRENWKPGYISACAEALRMSFADSRSDTLYLASRDELVELMEEKSGKSFGVEFKEWFKYCWEQQAELPPEYAQFKEIIYKTLDDRFIEYFNDQPQATIRLDEVLWGGVQQDGIPPLRNPEMLEANEADYLDDTNVVFGIEINGDARAYPNRILAHHEMFCDTIGGVSVCGVY